MASQELKEVTGLNHIRLRPSMYIGTTHDAKHLYREARDNGIDEVINGYATDLWIVIKEDGALSIRDNGRGLPITPMLMSDGKIVPQARAAVSYVNVSSHYEGYGTSVGTHGVGAKAITALSDYTHLTIWKDGKRYDDNFVYDTEFEQSGVPTVNLTSKGAYRAQSLTKDLLPASSTSLSYHGTEITFLPSESIFEDIDFDFEWIREDLQRTAYLNPTATFHILDELSGKQATIHEEGGLKAYVSDLIEKSEGDPITQVHEFEGEFQDPETPGKRIKAKVAMAWFYVNYSTS